MKIYLQKYFGHLQSNIFLYTECDIENRGDIEMLVNEFYNKVREEEVIGFIFVYYRK